MSNAHSRRSVVLEKARVQQLVAPSELKVAVTVYASPAWRGVEGDIWLAQWEDTTRIYKHYHPDTAFYVDAASAMECAEQTALLGVAPLVTHRWPEQGLLEMQHLGEGWRCAGLQDAANPSIRTRIIAAKKSVQAGPCYARTTTIFNEIRALYSYCVQSEARLPRYIEAFMDFARRAEDAIGAVGMDQVPSHRDGNTSNLMIGPQQEVMLLDFDLAANADPFEDIGCYLAEMYECEPEARAGFEEWHGRFDEALFQRAVVYGMLDNLRWGLIATGMAATSPRRTLEFSKYACWRYLRFEQHSQQSYASDRLRRLSTQ